MSQSTKLQVPLVAGFVLLLAVAAGSIWLYFAANRFNAEVSASLQIRATANRLLLLVQDAETGQRGFLLTHDPQYLEPYTKGAEAAPQAVADLQRNVAGSPIESRISERLNELVEAKLRELASTLAPARNGDFAAALAIVKNNTGNGFMQNIRDEVALLDFEEAGPATLRRDRPIGRTPSSPSSRRLPSAW